MLEGGTASSQRSGAAGGSHRSGRAAAAPRQPLFSGGPPPRRLRFRTAPPCPTSSLQMHVRNPLSWVHLPAASVSLAVAALPSLASLSLAALARRGRREPTAPSRRPGSGLAWAAWRLSAATPPPRDGRGGALAAPPNRSVSLPRCSPPRRDSAAARAPPPRPAAAGSPALAGMEGLAAVAEARAGRRGVLRCEGAGRVWRCLRFPRPTCFFASPGGIARVAGPRSHPSALPAPPTARRDPAPPGRSGGGCSAGAQRRRRLGVGEALVSKSPQAAGPA